MALNTTEIAQLSNSGLGTIAINTRTVSEDVAIAHLLMEFAKPRNMEVLIWDADLSKDVGQNNRGRLQKLALDDQGRIVRSEGSTFEIKGHPVLSVLRFVTEQCQKFITDRTPPTPTLFLFQDLYPFIAERNTDTGIERAFINTCKALKRSRHRMILFHENIKLPTQFRDLVEETENPLPSESETHDILERRIAALLKSAGSRKLRNQLSEDDTKKLIRALRGMTPEGMDDAIQLAAIQQGKIDADLIPKILERKKRQFAARGIEYAQPPDVLVQGMPILEEWARTQLSLLEPSAKEEWNLDFPRGALLVGEAGTGKTLAVRCVAQVWGLPVILLDTSKLMQKELGASEKNLRDTIAAAESMSPCILFIDEIDKMLPSGSGDGDTGRRMFGYFIQWFQNHDRQVFVAATANEPWGFKPELLRRFTQRFYIDLPSTAARKDIFRVQMQKRRLQPFDEARLELLSRHTADFSGDEIQLIVTACATNAYAQGRPGQVSLEEFYAEIDRTPAQFRNNPPRLKQLREWAAAGHAAFVDPDALQQHSAVTGDREVVWNASSLETPDDN